MNLQARADRHVFYNENSESLSVEPDFFYCELECAQRNPNHLATFDRLQVHVERCRFCDYVKRFVASHDANDLLYAVNASRNYDPSPQLEKISVPVMFVNSADDFVNPPELGIAEREIQRVNKGRLVLIPISEHTHGHGTHTWAAVWQQYLKELLEASQH